MSHLLSAIYAGSGGMGKTCMMARMLQSMPPGKPVLVINSEASLFKQSPRRAPEAHNPQHTPAQRLGEGVRRAMAKLGNRGAAGLLYVEHLLRAMGVACLWQRATYRRMETLRTGKTKALRWGGGGRNILDHEDFLITDLGCFDSHGNHWSSLVNATRARGAINRQGFQQVRTADEDERLNAVKNIEISQAMTLFFNPHRLEEVRDELVVACLESGTNDLERASSGRRL